METVGVSSWRRDLCVLGIVRFLDFLVVFVVCGQGVLLSSSDEIVGW